MSASSTGIPARRAFLRGRPVPPALPRPPGALPEAEFLERCLRCSDCVSACPEQVIGRGDGGFPILDARRGECTFCGDCASACQRGALSIAALADWPWRVALGAGCLSAAEVVCQGCRDACGERAISFAQRGTGAPLIDLERCTGCGACVAACPTASLRLAIPEPQATCA